MYREFSCTTSPQFPLLLLPCITVVHLLPLMNEYLYIIINYSLQFMLRFTLPFEHSVDFDKQSPVSNIKASHGTVSLLKKSPVFHLLISSCLVPNPQ